MKQIINIQEQFGAELHTRQMMERLTASLDANNEYLLDMSGVEQISRSAADELYNLTHSGMHVDLINMPIIHCATIGSVQRQLMAQ